MVPVQTTQKPTVEVIKYSQLRGRGRFASACYLVCCSDAVLSRACPSAKSAAAYVAGLVQSGKAVR